MRIALLVVPMSNSRSLPLHKSSADLAASTRSCLTRSLTALQLQDAS